MSCNKVQLLSTSQLLLLLVGSAFQSAALMSFLSTNKVSLLPKLSLVEANSQLLVYN